LVFNISGISHAKKAEYVTAFPSLDHVYGTDPSSVKDTAVQTDTTMNEIRSMSDEIKQLKAKLNEESTLLREAFTETVTKNDENVRLYTGLPSLALLLRHL
jgi:hypothetical protein